MKFSQSRQNSNKIIQDDDYSNKNLQVVKMDDYASTNLQGEGKSGLNKSFGTLNIAVMGGSKDKNHNNKEEEELFTIANNGEKMGKIKNIDEEDEDDENVESGEDSKKNYSSKDECFYKTKLYIKENGIEMLNIISYLLYIILFISTAVDFRQISFYYLNVIPFDRFIKTNIFGNTKLNVSLYLISIYKYNSLLNFTILVYNYNTVYPIWHGILLPNCFSS